MLKILFECTGIGMSMPDKVKFTLKSMKHASFISEGVRPMAV